MPGHGWRTAGRRPDTAGPRQRTSTRAHLAEAPCAHSIAEANIARSSPAPPRGRLARGPYGRPQLRLDRTPLTPHTVGRPGRRATSNIRGPKRRSSLGVFGRPSERSAAVPCLPDGRWRPSGPRRPAPDHPSQSSGRRMDTGRRVDSPEHRGQRRGPPGSSHQGHGVLSVVTRFGARPPGLHRTFPGHRPATGPPAGFRRPVARAPTAHPRSVRVESVPVTAVPFTAVPLVRFPLIGVTAEVVARGPVVLRRVLFEDVPGPGFAPARGVPGGVR